MIGKEIPDFDLEGRVGEEVYPGRIIGKKTLAVFWSTDVSSLRCDDGSTVAPAVGTDRTADDPELVVFSEGTADDHEKLAIDAPIFLEDNYETAMATGHGLGRRRQF